MQECVSRGPQSSGFAEFALLAPGLKDLPDDGYRLYLESLFDEISTEVGVLFDRLAPGSLLWPRRRALQELLEILNAADLASCWQEDESIGWVYQYFNSLDERQAIRQEARSGPRNSRELAILNQFFTPRYVVEFLVDNTLGRLWWEMTDGETELRDRCRYLMVRPDERPDPLPTKDPRDLKILDPACGSGHFLLYSFDLLERMYREAWDRGDTPASAVTGTRLRDDYAETRRPAGCASRARPPPQPLRRGHRPPRHSDRFPRPLAPRPAGLQGARCRAESARTRAPNEHRGRRTATRGRCGG